MEDTIEKEKKTFVLNIMLDIITYKHVTITKYKNSDRLFFLALNPLNVFLIKRVMISSISVG